MALRGFRQRSRPSFGLSLAAPIRERSSCITRLGTPLRRRYFFNTTTCSTRSLAS